MVYETTTGALSRSLPGAWNYQWPPSGHELAFSDSNGVSLISEPGDPRSEPQALAGRCCSALWNPVR